MKSYLLVGVVGFKVAGEEKIKLVRDYSLRKILMPKDRGGQAFICLLSRKPQFKAYAGNPHGVCLVRSREHKHYFRYRRIIPFILNFPAMTCIIYYLY